MSIDVDDGTGTRIIAAAVRVLADNGMRRATVESVARYAGVSHMTIYRRWPTKDELFRAALESERDRVLAAGYRAASAKASFDDSVVAGFTVVLWEIIKNPLMVRGLRAEPEDMLPHLTVGYGKQLDASVTACSRWLTKAAEAEGIQIVDVDAVSEVVVRVAHSVLLTSQATPAFKTRAKVEGYTRKVLLPIVKSACGPGAAAKS